MDLAQIIAEVVQETRRPDLTTRITSAVKNATLRLHQSEMFARDLTEGRVGTDDYTSVAPDSRYVIPEADIARFRAFNFFKDYDASTLVIGKEYSIESSPVPTLNEWGVARTGLIYRAGVNFIVKTGDLLGSKRSFYASWYQNPNITDSALNSWIAVDHPWAIIWAAVARIHRGNGKAEEANAAQQDASVEYSNILTSNIQLQGR